MVILWWLAVGKFPHGVPRTRSTLSFLGLVLGPFLNMQLRCGTLQYKVKTGTSSGVPRAIVQGEHLVTSNLFLLKYLSIL